MSQSQAKSWGVLVRELFSGLQGLLFAEIELARTEVKQAAHLSRRRTLGGGIGAIFASSGLFALTAFLILFLGEQFQGNYRFSSLLVGLVFLGFGLGLIWSSTRPISSGIFTFPKTRKSLQESLVLLIQSSLEAQARTLYEGSRQTPSPEMQNRSQPPEFRPELQKEQKAS